MSDDSDSDHSFGDWVENGSDSVKCLICEQSFNDVPEAIVHCSKDHSFDFSVAKRKYNMDFYSYIKCINYTRTQVQEDENFNPSTLFELDSQPWNDDKYLSPVIKDDPWLMIGKKF
jgi:protein arginine N-methyltransferase 3